MTTATLTLTEFLLARVAEDEATAKAAVRTSGTEWVADRFRVVVDGEFEVVEGNPKTAAHIARHDPARVLAECEAKRRIVEMRHPDDVDDTLWDQGYYDGIEAACRHLAAIYASHPDYREEWSA